MTSPLDSDCKGNLTDGGAREWFIVKGGVTVNALNTVSMAINKTNQAMVGDDTVHVIEYSAYLKLREELAAIQSENARLRGALEIAIEYLEPRLANKTGSRGWTMVLPVLRQALESQVAMNPSDSEIAGDRD